MNIYKKISIDYRDKVLNMEELRKHSNYLNKKQSDWLILTNTWNKLLLETRDAYKTSLLFPDFKGIIEFLQYIYGDQDANNFNYGRFIDKHPYKVSCLLVYFYENGKPLQELPNNKLRRLENLSRLLSNFPFNESVRDINGEINLELTRRREGPHSKGDTLKKYFMGLERNKIYKKSEIIYFSKESLKGRGDIISDRAALVLAERIVPNLYLYSTGEYCLLDQSDMNLEMLKLKMIELVFEKNIFSVSLLRREFGKINPEWIVFMDSTHLIHNFLKKNLNIEEVNFKRMPIVTSIMLKKYVITDCFSWILEQELENKSINNKRNFIERLRNKYGFTDVYTANLMTKNHNIKNEHSTFYYSKGE